MLTTKSALVIRKGVVSTNGRFNVLGYLGEVKQTINYQKIKVKKRGDGSEIYSEKILSTRKHPDSG